MGRLKLSLELAPGKPLGAFALRSLLACGAAPVFVVVRPDDPCGWMAEAVARGEVQRLPCPDADGGLSFSIRCGVRAAEAAGADAVMIVLADQPFVRPEDLRALSEAASADPALDFAACRYGGSYDAPPAIFARRMFPALAGLSGDRGARALLSDGTWRGRTLAVDGVVSALDVDTPEAWRSAIKSYARMCGSGEFR
ncbi:NTP transferase domain-containing protein [Cohnella sp. REN36]|uniref:nucleotidyltransferase family protein n=1 Tax=Cohnella sp. REN36 TaxID=2887347 RepID=UPI0021048A5D|nr:nucleotidyltransferase family protein [Cohnella sp. REN36]